MDFWVTAAKLIKGAIALGKRAHAAYELLVGKSSHQAAPATQTTIVQVQSVIAVAPGAIVSLSVPLDGRIRDLLEIPRNVGLAALPLIVAGKGVVKPSEFITEAMDTMVMRAERPVRCDTCQRLRYLGAYSAQRWLCQDCFKPHLENVTWRGRDLTSFASLYPRPWAEIDAYVGRSRANEFFSSDPILSTLVTSSVRPADSPGGRFVKVWVEQIGHTLYIRSAFHLMGCSGSECRAFVFFYNAAGERLRDRDGQYDAADGSVVATRPPTLIDSDDAYFDEWLVTIPSSQLHLPAGRHAVACRIRIYSRRHKAYVLKSDLIEFRCAA